MLDELGWLSLNQLAAETRLVEAWKTAKSEDYCLNDILKKKRKGPYSTRSNDKDLFERGVEDLHGSADFVNPTARIWNEAPDEIKNATRLSEAKRCIRNFVKTLPL